MTLEETKINQTVIITDLLVQGSIRRRLLDLGILPNASIEPVYDSPSGQMRAYFVQGTMIALRDRESKQILVKERG